MTTSSPIGPAPATAATAPPMLPGDRIADATAIRTMMLMGERGASAVHRQGRGGQRVTLPASRDRRKLQFPGAPPPIAVIRFVV